MVDTLVRYGADVSVLDLHSETLRHRQVVELVVDVMCVPNIAFQAKDRESLKSLGLVHHRVQALRIFKGSDVRFIRIGTFLGLSLSSEILHSATGLLDEVRRFKDLRLLEDFGFNGVRGE